MKISLALSVLFISFSCFGQSFKTYENTIENGMIVLSTMAGTNMGVSTYNLIEGTDNKDFNVTNLAWNGINLGIGIFGLVTTKKSFKKINSQTDLVNHLKKQRNILWINAGIDIGYIGLGVWRRSKNKGQGNAIIYNGTLLFVFDSILGMVLHKKIKNIHAPVGIGPAKSGVGIAITLDN